jgi:hypothetical protein
MKILNGLIIGSSIILSVFIYQCHLPKKAKIAEIHLSGDAENDVLADVFIANFTCSSIGDTLDKVKEEAKANKKEIVAVLDAAGLKKDTDYSIAPRNISQEKEHGSIFCKSTQTFYIKTEKIDNGENAVKLIELLAEKGIAISDFAKEYNVKDPEALQKELFARAIMDAQDKATQIARSTGGKLFGLPSIWYSSINILDKNAVKYKWGACGKGETRNLIARISVICTFNYNN